MSGPIDFSCYSTVLFMDSMVALEGKPLPNLPWKEIDATGPILVLIVPQVMKEVDKRKRDGRLGKRARQFNQLAGPAAESGGPIQVVAGPPKVDIAFATCDRIKWDAFDDLDPEEGDSRVVAELLHTRGLPNDRKLLLSHDNNPIAMASRHGIKTRRMPDHWLLEPEPSPSEKELVKLKARVSELEAKEPAISVDLAFNLVEPVQLYRILSLSEADRERLQRRILEKNRRIARPSGLGMTSFYPDNGYEEKYRKYTTESVPQHVQQFHHRLEIAYSQIPFVLTVQNDGHVQAENLVVTLTAPGGGLHNKFRFFPPGGPSAPQRKDGVLPYLRHDFLPREKEPVGRHEIEFAVGPDGGDTIEVQCADFRHGRVWIFDGIVRIDPRKQSPFRVEVEITASNQRGSIRKSFDVSFDTKSVEVVELFSIEDFAYVVDVPMVLQFNEAIEKGNLHWFDLSDDLAVDDQ